MIDKIIEAKFKMEEENEIPSKLVLSNEDHINLLEEVDLTFRDGIIIDQFMGMKICIDWRLNPGEWRIVSKGQI